MKRITSAVLAATLLVGIVSATETATQTTNNSLITYEQIDALVREGNTTIKSNEFNMIAFENQDNNNSDIQDGIFGGLAALDAQQNALFELKNNLPDAGLGDEFDGNIQKQNVVISALIDAQIASIESTKRDMSSGLSDLNPTSEEDIQQMRDQFDMIADQIVSGAQTMYLAYNSMDLQKDELKNNLTSLERNIVQLEKRYELGQISLFDLESARNGKSALENGVSSLEFEMIGLEQQLNIMMGRKFSDEISISPTTANVSADISAMNLEQDIITATENNFELNNQLEELDDFEDMINDTSPDVDRTAMFAQQDNMELQIEVAKDNIEYKMSNLVRSIEERQRLLENEKTNLDFANRELEIAKTKYDRGMISKLEYLTAQDNVASAENNLKSAELNIKTAVEQYKWALDGILPQ